jgi:hypothetical protein
VHELCADAIIESPHKRHSSTGATVNEYHQARKIPYIISIELVLKLPLLYEKDERIRRTVFRPIAFSPDATFLGAGLSRCSSDSSHYRIPSPDISKNATSSTYAAFSNGHAIRILITRRR